MIRNIWTLFETEEEKEKKEIREKKTLIIDYIKIEQLEILGHFLNNSNNKKIIINQKKQVISIIMIILSMKVMVIEIETHH